jgi:hypothetical protein
MIMRLMETGRASRVGFGDVENKSVDRYQSWMFNRMKHLDSKCNLPRSHPSPPPPPSQLTHFNGMNLELCVAPIPGLPCLTGL